MPPQHAQPAKQSQSAETVYPHSLMPASSVRLTPPHEEHNVGEQVAGSHTRFQIHAPFNLNDLPAVAYFTVEGDGFKLVSTTMLTLPPVGASPELANMEANSPTIVFAPSHSGNHRGRLAINVGWGDGHVEHQFVDLRGRARAIDEAPTHEKAASELAEEKAIEKFRTEEGAKDARARAIESKRTDPVANAIDKKFDGGEGIVGKVKTAAGGLALAQRLGCETVARENAKYVQRIPKTERSVWWDLAEMALTAGTAGLATELAKHLLPRIKDVFKTDGERLSAAAAKFSEFTTDAIKDGLKQAGKKAISAGMTAISANDPLVESDHDTDQAGYGHSTNREIDFFAEQQSILNRQAVQNEYLVAEQSAHLRPMLRHDPDHAQRVMEKLQEQFEESAAYAEQNQARESSAQWTAFVARLRLGVEHPKPRPGEKAAEATRMEVLHPGKPEVSPKAVPGVIKIYMSNEHPPLKVERAILQGISQATADRLATMELSTVPMPIQFILKSPSYEPTVITRDEAGRVRVSGSLAGSNEADAVARATTLIEHALAKPLGSLGVGIETDDATGHGAK